MNVQCIPTTRRDYVVSALLERGGDKKKEEGKKNVGAPHNMTGETNYHFGLIILECLRTLLKNCRRLLSISDKQQIQI